MNVAIAWCVAADNAVNSGNGWGWPSKGTLQIDIADPLLIDQLRCSGQMSLAGSLKVTLAGGYIPAIGDSFDILDWGTITEGKFSKLLLQPPGGSLGWDTSKLYSTGVLSIANIGFVFGDANRDGHVDGSDLSDLLQLMIDVPSYKSTYKLSDSNVVSLADLNHDGKVNNLDLQALLDLIKSGGGSVVVVPEPSAPAHLLGAFIAIAIYGAGRSIHFHA